VRCIGLFALAVLVAACSGSDEREAAEPAFLDVMIVDAGERRSEAFRLTEGRLVPLAGGLRRRTVFNRAGSEPDRQSIVWEEIYLRGADGSERKLTNDERADLSPQLLRDGRVAFVSCEFHERGLPPTCSLDAIDPRSGDRETLLEELGIVFGGEVSPDESRFLFTRLHESGVTVGLFVRELDGGGERKVLAGSGGTWSPDARRIAFLSDRDENGRCLFHDCIGHANEIYVANADGSDEQRLTANPEVEGTPEWSSDGEWLVFGRIPDEDADWDLYAVRADGECEIQLTDTSRWEVAASWHGGGHGGLNC
jgi:Tol biopolymer transport system component